MSHKYYPKEKTELTEDQKEFITNNCGAMKPMDMAKVTFDDPRISPLDLRYKVLFEFLNTINNKVKYSDVTNERRYCGSEAILHRSQKLEHWLG